MSASVRNTVRLSNGQNIPLTVATEELFVSVDPSRDIPYVVHDDSGALRWAEITVLTPNCS